MNTIEIWVKSVSGWKMAKSVPAKLYGYRLERARDVAQFDYPTLVTARWPS
jgi:hypothetical protein